MCLKNIINMAVELPATIFQYSSLTQLDKHKGKTAPGVNIISIIIIKWDRLASLLSSFLLNSHVT